MSMRKDFEDWYKREIWPQALFRMNDTFGVYEDSYCQVHWRSWQASRHSISVHIPSMSESKYMEYYPDVEGGCFNRQAYIDDLVIVLETAGLRLKP